MPKTKKFKEKYITYDGINDNFKVRVTGYKQVIRKTYEEAIAERNRKKKKKSVGRINIDPDTTIGDWIELFLQEHCKNCRQATIEGYQADLERCCEPLYDIPIKDCKTSDVDNVLLALCKKGTAKSTVTRTRAILHKLFNTLIKKNYLPANLVPGPNFIEITDTLIVKNKCKIPRQAFPEETLRNLVTAAKTFDLKDPDKCKKYAAAITILINTGMRVSEFLALRKCDVEIDEDNSEVTFYIWHSVRPVTKRNSDDNRCWQIGPPKNSNGYRHFTIADKDTVESVCYLKNQEHKSVKQGDETYNFLFATKFGTPVLESNFSDDFRLIRVKADAYKDIRNQDGTETLRYYIKIYEIRHSVATILAHESTYKDQVEAANMLGHTVDVFRKIYVHPIESKQKELAKKLSKRLTTG